MRFTKKRDEYYEDSSSIFQIDDDSIFGSQKENIKHIYTSFEISEIGSPEILVEHPDQKN